jgi:hypothetical protein
LRTGFGICVVTGVLGTEGGVGGGEDTWGVGVGVSLLREGKKRESWDEEVEAGDVELVLGWFLEKSSW